jgi:hypothetical protein
MLLSRLVEWLVGIVQCILSHVQWPLRGVCLVFAVAVEATFVACEVATMDVEACVVDDEDTVFVDNVDSVTVYDTSQSVVTIYFAVEDVAVDVAVRVVYSIEGQNYHKVRTGTITRQYSASTQHYFLI